MPPGSSGDQGLDLLVERFLGLVTEGRGDLARGRHLYSLRALDALWDPDGVLRLPYRPSRNPGAFLAMVFDLAGDACYGYTIFLDGGAGPTDDLVTRVATHLRARLSAPWPRLTAELDRLGLPHLARMLSDFVPTMLQGSSLSRLPDELARLRSWMTKGQAAAFDTVAYVATLPFARVLELVGWPDDHAGRVGREQHPTGGDLRSLLRRRLDGPWSLALLGAPAPDLAGLLASMPVAPEDLARQGEEGGFAVAYALATDAPPPGRRWRAPAPFVTEPDREEYAFLTGSGAEDGSVRRATRLERWGASLVFPRSFELVDARLTDEPSLGPLHAGGDWRGFVGEKADELADRRMEFMRRVANTLLDGVTGSGSGEVAGAASDVTAVEREGVAPDEEAVA